MTALLDRRSGNMRLIEQARRLHESIMVNRPLVPSQAVQQPNNREAIGRACRVAAFDWLRRGRNKQCANGGFMLLHGLSTPGNLQGFVALSSRNCSAAACRRRCIPARRLRDNLCTNWCSPVSQPRLMRFKSVSGRQILVGEDRIESDRLLQMSGLQQHPLVGIRASGRHSAVRDDGFPHVAERTQKHLLVK
jgi:hypothetical protein